MPTLQKPSEPTHAPAAGIASFISHRLGGSKRLVAHVTSKAVLSNCPRSRFAMAAVEYAPKLVIALSSPFLCDRERE